MNISDLIKDGQMTEEGKKIAHKMYNDIQCDRVPCWGCSHHNRETKGPGGDTRCPVKGIFTARDEVDQLLTLYMGRKPGLEALDAFLKR